MPARPASPGAARAAAGLGRAFGLALALAACVPSPAPLPAGRTIAAAEDLTAARLDREPEPAPGRCFHAAVEPAVFETVTEQVIDRPPVLDAAGAVVAPAAVRSETRQRLVRERRSLWFEVPCPEAEDANFVASLQRALKARGLYEAAVTGEVDAETRAAIRRYQAPRGIDSDRLSLAAARALGLAPVAVED